MLTVSTSTGWMSKQISQQRISKVVKAAQEHAAKTEATETTEPAEKSDDPKYMGPMDRFVDHYLCGGAKKSALDNLYDLSFNTALLEQELGKDEQTINQSRIERYISQIKESKTRLRILTEGKSIEFGEKGYSPIIGKNAFLIVRKSDQLSPSGIELVQLKSKAATRNPSPTGLPTFLNPEQISHTDLNLLNAKGAFVCANETYAIRFTDDNEPVLMTESTNSLTAQIQERLSALWINSEARRELEDLDLVRLGSITDLNLKPSFLDTWDEGARKNAQLYLAKTWEPTAKTINQKYLATIERIRAPIIKEYVALRSEIARLADNRNPSVADRKRLFELQALTTALLKKLNTANTNIGRINVQFERLISILTQCKNLTMVDILTKRIALFSAHLCKISESNPDSQDMPELNTLFRIQEGFLDHFGPSQLAQCDQILNSPMHEIAEANAQRAPELHIPIQGLVDSLKDPFNSWDQVHSQMQTCHDQQVELDTNRFTQVDILVRLNAVLQNLIDFTDGLNRPGNQLKTYFQPVTYTHFVYLLKLRNVLADGRNLYSRRELEEMQEDIHSNLKPLLLENSQLEKQKEKLTFFQSLKTFDVLLNPDQTFMDYEEWCLTQSRKNTSIQ
ncbi:hypothetical protein AAKU67_003042 [Oxalobacteraceae bacterium GrIS 2.11]